MKFSGVSVCVCVGYYLGGREGVMKFVNWTHIAKNLTKKKKVYGGRRHENMILHETKKTP